MISGIFAGPAAARDREPDFQQWTQLYISTKWSHKLLFDFDLQARRLNAPLLSVSGPGGEVRREQNPNTVLMVRPFVGYQFAPWLAAWVGYAWVPDFFDNPSVRETRNISEHRVFEQLSLSGNFGAFSLGSRTRLEQRVRSDGPGSAENDAGQSRWAHRFREQVRLAYTVAESPFQLIVWDELFVHLNRTNYPSKAGFDHNRAFVGAGYQATSAIRAELGYMNQFVRRYTDANQLNHVLLMSLYMKFDASGGR